MSERLLPPRLTARIDLASAAAVLLVLAGSYVMARAATGGNLSSAGLGAVLGAAAGCVLLTLRNWRTGVLLLLMWLILEDLPRKYLGNNLLIYFGKDLLAAATYLGFLLALSRREVQLVRAPFMVPLAFFAGLGVVQLLNPHSPSPLFGLMGLKIYFFYVPLMFVAYAWLRTEADLDRFFQVVLGISVVVAVLALVQAVVGGDFLTPRDLAPELEALGRELRYAPISGRSFYRPTSVFVSEARLGSYLFLILVLALGAWSHAFLARKPWRGLAACSAVLAAVALFVHGSRAGVLYGATSVVGIIAILLAAPSIDRTARRALAKRTALTAGAGLTAAATFAFAFPDVITSRWALYAESINPWSPATELFWRVWGYPWLNLRGAFGPPTWPMGQGIGVASLGVPYLEAMLGRPAPVVPVESGYGTLVLEMGILGLALWLAWTTMLVASGVSVVRRLAGRSTFPVGVSILWFAFVLLFPLTFGALNAYQNYTYNAMLWLLVGVLLRLPTLERVSMARA